LVLSSTVANYCSGQLRNFDVCLRSFQCEKAIFKLENLGQTTCNAREQQLQWNPTQSTKNIFVGVNQLTLLHYEYFKIIVEIVK